MNYKPQMADGSLLGTWIAKYMGKWDRAEATKAKVQEYLLFM